MQRTKNVRFAWTKCFGCPFCSDNLLRLLCFVPVHSAGDSKPNNEKAVLRAVCFEVCVGGCIFVVAVFVVLPVNRHRITKHKNMAVFFRRVCFQPLDAFWSFSTVSRCQVTPRTQNISFETINMAVLVCVCFQTLDVLFFLDRF